MEWAAIDFETANGDRSSACSVGIVIVREAQIIETKSWLIRPPTLYFDPYNVMIHGISEADVEDQPTFDELWPEVHSVLNGCPVVAHNASFDFSVLRHTLDEYGITYPDMEYYCTRVIAKAAWPTLPSYALQLVADYLGIAFEHHIARDDARACAEIALRCCQETGADGLRELSSRLGVTPGFLCRDGYCPCSMRQAEGAVQKPQAAALNPDHPFFGKTVVFTGALRGISRREAMQLVLAHGGQCEDSVTKRTHFLVVGDFDFRKFTHGDKSTKLLKAERMKAMGADIEILSEDEWRRMLDLKKLMVAQV